AFDFAADLNGIAGQAQGILILTERGLIGGIIGLLTDTRLAGKVRPDRRTRRHFSREKFSAHRPSDLSDIARQGTGATRPLQQARLSGAAPPHGRATLLPRQ